MADCDTREGRVRELRQLIRLLVSEAIRPDCPPARKAALLARLESLYRDLFAIQAEFEFE